MRSCRRAGRGYEAAAPRPPDSVWVPLPLTSAKQLYHRALSTLPTNDIVRYLERSAIPVAAPASPGPSPESVAKALGQLARKPYPPQVHKVAWSNVWGRFYTPARGTRLCPFCSDAAKDAASEDATGDLAGGIPEQTVSHIFWDCPDLQDLIAAFSAWTGVDPEPLRTGILGLHCPAQWPQPATWLTVAGAWLRSTHNLFTARLDLAPEDARRFTSREHCDHLRHELNGMAAYVTARDPALASHLLARGFTRPDVAADQSGAQPGAPSQRPPTVHSLWLRPTSA